MTSYSEITSATNDTKVWCLCFSCKSGLKEPITKLSMSVKLKNNSERILACYEKVIDNTRQLNDLGELPNSIFTDDVMGVVMIAIF